MESITVLLPIGPCAHVLCEACAPDFKKCPLCREKIVDTLELTEISVMAKSIWKSIIRGQNLVQAFKDEVSGVEKEEACSACPLFK